MATKNRNVVRQAAFSAGKNHAPSGYLRGNNGIVLTNTGTYKAIASDKVGIVTTSGSQAFKDPALAGFGDDYFNNWALIAHGNCKNTSNLTVGQMNLVSDYHDDGTFDTDWNWLSPDSNTTAKDVQEGDEFILAPLHLLPDGMMRWENAVVLTASPTTGTQASHEIFTVTGLCQIRILPLVVTTLVSTSNTGTIELGTASDMNFLITTTTVGSGALAAGQIWVSATEALILEQKFSTDCILDFVTDGQDIGYDVNTNNITSGVLKFICWWKPLESGATVVPALGTGTL